MLPLASGCGQHKLIRDLTIRCLQESRAAVKTGLTPIPALADWRDINEKILSCTEDSC